MLAVKIDNFCCQVFQTSIDVINRIEWKPKVFRPKHRIEGTEAEHKKWKIAVKSLQLLGETDGNQMFSLPRCRVRFFKLNFYRLLRARWWIT